MGRTDSAARVVPTDAARTFAALVDPDALTTWLPPAGMSGRFERYDARPGGGYRLVLTHRDPASYAGKAGGGTDVVEARFVEITAPMRVVQAVDFPSGDPAYAGTMTMTWEVTPHADGARVEIRADDVPPGISAAEHAAGLASSLDQLADYLARWPAP